MDKTIEKIIDHEIKKFLNITNIISFDKFQSSKDKKTVSDFQFRIFKPFDDSIYYISDLEKSLDSFIRLLFNSVFDKLFDFYGFDYEFYESNIFSGLFEPTKEYEMRISYEFLVKKDGKYIGFRYSNLQDKEVIDLVSNYTQYKMFIDKMDGFEKGPICKLCILDFNDRLGEFKYDKNERPIPYLSLKEFLNTFFSDIDYVEFYNKINSAIRSTNDILAMQVTPKLLSNNIFKFKKKVSDSFVSCIHSLKYVFKENTRFCTLNSEVNEFAFADLFEVEKCIIGNSDFSKCFISAEYLFSVIGGNLKLDFTPIVLGYIKSIAQINYIFNLFLKNKKNFKKMLKNAIILLKYSQSCSIIKKNILIFGVGIIAKVSTECAKYDANIVDISQSVLSEYFAMIMLADIDDLKVPFSEFVDILSSVGRERGLSINVMHEDIFNTMHHI